MIEKMWISIPCEKCGYETPAQLLDVKLQTTIYCYNCKIGIKLIDKDSSTITGIRDIENAIKNLFNF